MHRIIIFGNVGAPYLFCISFREIVVIQRVVLPIIMEIEMDGSYKSGVYVDKKKESKVFISMNVILSMEYFEP